MYEKEKKRQNVSEFEVHNEYEEYYRYSHKRMDYGDISLEDSVGRGRVLDSVGYILTLITLIG